MSNIVPVANCQTCKEFLTTLMALQISNTKYQLPGSNNMYVDLVDDEDVKLMFDEWSDYLAEEGKASRNAKLHIYIDWQSKHSREAGMPSGGPAAGLDNLSETASADTPVARAPPPPTLEGRTYPQSSAQEDSPMGQSGLFVGTNVMHALQVALWL